MASTEPASCQFAITMSGLSLMALSVGRTRLEMTGFDEIPFAEDAKVRLT